MPDPYNPQSPNMQNGMQNGQPNLQNGWQQLRARMAQAMAGGMAGGMAPTMQRAQNLAVYDPAGLANRGFGAMGAMPNNAPRQGMQGTQSGREPMPGWMGNLAQKAYGVRY